MEAKFLRVGEESYKNGKRQNRNKPHVRLELEVLSLLMVFSHIDRYRNKCICLYSHTHSNAYKIALNNKKF